MPSTQELAEIVWRPDDNVIRQSNLQAFMREQGITEIDALFEAADNDPAWFWAALLEYADIHFERSFDQLMDVSNGVPWARWCRGGTTNFTLECLERHADDPDRIAIVGESECGDTDGWSHARLVQEVARFAGALKSRGVGVGDTVGIYLPMIPEVAVAFLAVARLGAVAVPLFSGFGEEALATRLEAAGAAHLLTCEQFRRRGESVSNRPLLDALLTRVTGLETVIVLGGDSGGAYYDWHALADASEPVQHAEIVNADSPLLLVYTSGTTGKPKGAVITHIGFAAKLAADLQLCLDLKASDRWLWMSDFGWIIGPIAVGGALMTGATLVLAEGAPNYPDPDRYWQLIERHRISFLGVAPTLIRDYMIKGALPSQHHNLESLRVLVSSGESWSLEAWHWCFEQVCQQRLPILNWSGGTEISGGILTGLVALPMKPAAFTRAAPAMGAVVMDAAGQELEAGAVGELVLKNASIGLTKSLWNDDDRYIDSYWSDYGDKWRHGDLVSRDEDGYWYLHGRSDDVLKIGGKRTGPTEIEELLLSTGLVGKVAVVGLPDERAGQVIACACVSALDSDLADQGELSAQLSQAVVAGMGRPYRPQKIVFVDDLPRTRSGKTVRRVVAAILSGRDPGDMSTLDNPEAVRRLQQAVEVQ